MEQRAYEAQLQGRGNGHPAPGQDSSLPCAGHLDKLFHCRTLRVVPPQYAVYSQGENPHTVCLVCGGLVKLTHTEHDGKRVIVGLRHKGWMLGAVSLLQNTPYETTAETVTRSKLCFVPEEILRRELDSNAELSRWMLTMLSEGLRASMISISEQALLSGRQRLVNFLWKLACARNGFDQEKPLKIQMVLKHWEVAQLLALTPQHLCRLVRQLEKDGVIWRKNGWLIVPDLERIRPAETGSFGTS